MKWHVWNEKTAHKNGNIEPTAAISSPGESSDSLPETDRQSESVSNKSSDRNEVFKYHTKLAVLAEYLADITTATLQQSNFTKEDIEFGHLIHDCGEELYGIGEYLIDASKQIADKVTQQSPIVIDMSESDSEVATVATPSQQVPETNINKETSSNVKNNHFILNVAGFGDIDVQPSPSGSVKKRKSVFVCELCGRYIESKPKLHKQIDHHVSNPYKCQTCSKSFYSIHHFNKHMIGKHKQHFECAECRKVFKIRSSWYNHMKIHKDIIYS